MVEACVCEAREQMRERPVPLVDRFWHGLVVVGEPIGVIGGVPGNRLNT